LCRARKQSGGLDAGSVSNRSFRALSWIESRPDGRLVSFSSPSIRGEVWANGGVYLISPGVLDSIGARFSGEVSLESEIMPALLESHSAIYGMRHHGRFIDIGLPADYERAADVLAGPKQAGSPLTPVQGESR
jgi:NDP-sugar pyrophosphorylase family protein